MGDVDTFLTILYVTVDDFCKYQSLPEPTPGPKASLSVSEVITLVIFSQWGRFRSEGDFYRYAAKRLVLNQIRIGRDKGDGVCVWRLGQ